MKIDLIDLDQPLTQQTVRVEGLSRKDLRAATWRGDDLLVRTQAGEVLVLKSALSRLLAKPTYFIVLDDAPVPLATFAPALELPPALSAPHLPPFSFSLPILVGRSPAGQRGERRTASEGDEAWADQAWAMLAVSAVEVAQDVPAPVVAAKPAASVAQPVDDEPVVVSCDCKTEPELPLPHAGVPTPAGAPMAASGDRSIGIGTWLSWAAMAKGSYELASRKNASTNANANANANATQAETTSADSASDQASDPGSDPASGEVATEAAAADNVAGDSGLTLSEVEAAMAAAGAGAGADPGAASAAQPQAGSDEAASFVRALGATPFVATTGGDVADLLAAARSAMPVIG